MSFSNVFFKLRAIWNIHTKFQLNRLRNEDFLYKKLNKFPFQNHRSSSPTGATARKQAWANSGKFGQVLLNLGKSSQLTNQVHSTNQLINQLTNQVHSTNQLIDQLINQLIITLTNHIHETIS